jgi:regulator of protease activity HflC (stomatin/prohibitin superfamily)
VAVPLWVWLLLGLAFAVGLSLLFRATFDRVTLLQYERALRYDKGKYAGLIGPGQYWIYRRRTTLVKLDLRPRFISVPGQEVLTSDAVTLRVSLAAEYEIGDPAVAVNETEDFEAALYLTLQLALREVIGTSEIDQLLAKREQFGERLLELCREPAEALGVKLHRVDLKDIMFPGELKKTFAQAVTARKEGLAALERARGETAALRNLANAARMLEGNPALMQLRLLQQIGESAGNTIVLGLPSSATPLPLKEPDVEQRGHRELPADEEG